MRSRSLANPWGRMMDGLADPSILSSAMASAIRPRRRLTVSEWADAHRVLPSKGASEKGPWRTSRTPYLREIMDALSDTSAVQRVVFMSSTQVGKTEVGLNWSGYIMHHAPGPMLAVVPTLDLRKRWVRQRLDPMLQETPVLAEIFDSRRQRDGANAEDMKDFPGGVMILSGANSPASLASMPIRYALLDEVDRFPWEVGKEGDPIGLIDERTKTFPRRKVLLVSTPTVKGESRIDEEFQASDQRHYHVPCPHCGDYAPMLWARVRWDAKLTRAWIVCEACGAETDEHHKTAMLEAGRWIPHNPGAAVRGYTVNALYSPIGLGWTWLELARDWMASQGDEVKLKRFINTALAEVWEDRREGIDHTHLLNRLEAYPEDMPRRVRSVGIDVQKDRIEVSVYDFGAGEECWGIDHIIVEGDTADAATWTALGEEIDAIRPDTGAIDSGYAADEVYTFARGRRWLFVTKGIKGSDKTFIEDDESRRRRLRKRRKKSHSPFLVGNVAAMMLITQRLRISRPEYGTACPGFIHFPHGEDAFDDEFFRQLASSAYVIVKRGKKSVYEWQEKATHPRNEAFDCWKLAVVGVRLAKINLDRAPREEAPAQVASVPEAAARRPVSPRRGGGIVRR